MSNLHLVTGYAGAAHITPEDHGSLYAAIFGSGSYVLDRGNKLSASAITSNQVRVLDGDMVIQGRHVRLAANSYVDLTIENGAQGVYRNDLIVARYTKSGSTGVEECNLVVIKGAAVASDPQDPEYITGDILGGGATQHDFPLYRVPLNGLTVEALVPLFSVAYLVTLGSNGKVPADYLPAMNYIPTSQRGAANGVAPLDSNKKIDSTYLPSMNYIPTSQKGAASGVASLDANKQIASSAIPLASRRISFTLANGTLKSHSLYLYSVGKLGLIFGSVTWTGDAYQSQLLQNTGLGDVIVLDTDIPGMCKLPIRNETSVLKNGGTISITLTEGTFTLAIATPQHSVFRVF